MHDPLAPFGLQGIPCPACGGDGYTLLYGGAHRVIPWDEGEEAVACSVCSGLGEIEVCPSCGEVPTLAGGLEVCGCTAAALPETFPRAA